MDTSSSKSERGGQWGTIVRALLVTGLWLCAVAGPAMGEDTAFHRKTTLFDPPR